MPLNFVKLTLLALLPFGLHAQTEPDFVKYTTAEGLPSNYVQSLAADAEGFVWAGTPNGLARFDGQRFRVFGEIQPNSGLPEKAVSKVFADQAAGLWVNFADSGLFRINLTTYRAAHFTKILGRENGFFTDAMLDDGQGSVWFSTAEGLAQFRQKTGDFQFFKLETDGKPLPVSQISRADEHRIWALNQRAGLFRFDPRTGVFEKYRPFENLLATDLKAIATDDDGLLWVANWYDEQRGLLAFDPKTETLRHVFNRRPGDPSAISSTDVWQIFPAGDSLWFPTNAGGLSLFDKRRGRFQNFQLDPARPESISSNQVICCTKDRFGCLWVATSIALHRIAPGQKSTRLLAHNPWLPNSLVSKLGLSLAKITDTLLVFGTMDGLSIYDRSTGNYRNVRLPAFNGNNYNNNINTAAPADANSFWVGTWSGLYRLDRRTGATLEHFITFSNAGQNHPETVKKMRVGPILRLCKDRRGTLWVSGQGGLVRRFFEKKLPREFEYLDTLVRDDDPLNDLSLCFFDHSDRQFFIGTQNGVVRHDPAAGTFEKMPLDFPGEKPPFRISQMSSAANGDLLLIVNVKPFRVQLREGQKPQVSRVEAALPPGDCLSILEDSGGDIWVCAHGGLARVSGRANSVGVTQSHPDTAPGASSFFYDAPNYLHGNSFHYVVPENAARDRDGNLYFMGTQGVTLLRPDRLAVASGVPPVRIISLKINGLTANLDAPIHQKTVLELPFRDNVFSLEFSALGSAIPALNRFAYRLDGSDWVELGNQNTLNFSNLAPGDYLLEVRGANSDGVWNEAGARLQIVIRPPWYRSWWAYFLYAGLLAAGGFWFYRFSLRQKLAEQETRRLMDLDAFKSRFFTNITHEFRTPLTVILGSLEIMKLEIEKLEIGKLGSEPTANFKSPISNFKFPISQFLISKISIIKRNGENLLRLINQILDLSKLESSALKLNYVRADVLPYLRYVAESLHSYANARNVLVRVESREPEIVMDYDPERLLQIVHNLLSNAVKFTPPTGGGRVVLRAGLRNLEGFVNLVEIQVSDTGAGIPPEDLPHVFDRFFQAKNQESARAGGSGIGLSLTRELVKIMGGEISVESELGKGTTFRVRLPLFVEESKNRGFEELTSPVHENSIPQILGSSIPQPFDSSVPQIFNSSTSQILLIEDNPDVVEYLAACLQGGLANPPYVLDFAYNGRAGIEKALETVPDLIISDVMMPEKDGFEVCETLKNELATSHIPIILLTARATVEDRIAGLRRGADVYLAKPFHREELLLQVGNLLETRRKLRERYSISDLGIGVSDLGGGEQIPNPNSKIRNLEDAFLLKIRAVLEARFADSGFSVEDLCREMAMSRMQVHRKLTALADCSTTEFVNAFRLEKARVLLRDTALNVSEIAYQTGWNDPKYFSRLFAEKFGQPPSEMRPKA